MSRRSALGAGAEFDLIRRFLDDADAEAAGPQDADDGDSARHVLVGPGDDCAVVTDGPLAVSVDMSIEGVHFRRDWLEPHEIGYRAAAAALSDLAAVAAQPVGVLVSLALTAADREAVAPAVLQGVRAAARAVGAAVIGGDVARTEGALTIDVVALGHVEQPVLRSGARVGDALWVTGWLGGATAAVLAWRAGHAPDDAARAAFAHPTPRTREAHWLAQQGVLHALIDVSDGVAGDAGHLSAAGGVSVEIEAERLPLHPSLAVAVPDVGDARMHALGGGEDYELLFAAADGAVEPLVADFEARFGTRLTRIGRVRAGQGVVLVHEDGTAQPLAGGYDHFREKQP